MNAFATPLGRSILRGLLWREWIANARRIEHLVAAWLIGIWILPAFASPGWFHVFGLWLAVSLGTALGGGEVIDGNEEFTLALPPTRGQRYLARLALGLTVVIGLLLVGVFAVYCDLPQLLWSLVIESGLTQPFPDTEADGWWSVLAIWIAVFSCTFAIAANAAASGGARNASLGAGLVVLVVGLGGYVFERHVTLGGGGFHLTESISGSDGIVRYPLLTITAYGALHFGYWKYSGKQVLAGGAASARTNWVTVLLVVAALVGLLGLLALR